MTADDAKPLSYRDRDSISDWAKPYVQYASENGLMNGLENNDFAPLLNATRAQVATVLARIFD